MNSKYLAHACRRSAFLLLFTAVDAVAQRPKVALPAAPTDVAAPAADAERTPEGVAMVVLQKGTGAEHPVPNDCVILRFTSWKRTGKLFATSGLRGETATQCLRTAIPGIAVALRSMSEGERRRIWIPAGLTYQPDDDARTGTPQGPPLTVDVELVHILKAPPTPADLTRPPAAALTTRSGVRVLILKRGTGKIHPAMSSRVKVHYTGWTATGELFESTAMDGHPAEVLLGTALPGWREGLPLLSPGDKARLWIPAALAHGDKPPDRKLPAGVLVYDIELLAWE